MQSNPFLMSSQRKSLFDCLRLFEQTSDALIALFASFLDLTVEHLFDRDRDRFLNREVHRFHFRFNHQLSLQSVDFTLPNTLVLAV